MSAVLGHRERVLRTLDYKDIDRIPIFFRAEEEVKTQLGKELNLKEELDFIRYYDADAIQIPVLYRDDMIRPCNEEGYFYDKFGSKYKEVKYESISSYTVVEPVLADCEDIDDIYKISWPGRNFLDLDECVKRAEAAHSTELAVYGGVWASLFTTARSLMGEENFLISVIENPEFIVKLIERLTDCYIEMNEAYLSACRKYIDIFYFGSDFGTQNSMLISRDMINTFFKPGMKRIADQAKSYGLKVMYHTCGSVVDIIPDLIDCGIDILDPVQVSAAKMQPENLAARFKGKICFHGGISTQTTLPFGSVGQVKEDTVSAIKALGPAGYILAPDQDMIGNVPAQNIKAMFDVAKVYKV